MIESKKPFHVLIFEDLVKDPIKEIKKVLRFLEETNGFKAEKLEERLLCLSENLQGTEKRNPKSIPKDPFSIKLKIHVNGIINSAQSMLSEANLSTNLSSYKQKIV